jgi:hypothetical protein
MKLLLYNLLFILVIVAKSQPSCNSTIEEKINFYNNFDIVLDTNGLNGDYSNCLELNTRLWAKKHIYFMVENKFINYTEGKTNYSFNDIIKNDETKFFHDYINNYIADTLNYILLLDNFTTNISPSVFSFFSEQYVNIYNLEDNWSTLQIEHNFIDIQIHFSFYMFPTNNIEQLSENNYTLTSNSLQIKNINNFEIRFYTVRGEEIKKYINQTLISLEKLNSGVYFAVINFKNQYKLIRILK